MPVRFSARPVMESKVYTYPNAAASEADAASAPDDAASKADAASEADAASGAEPVTVTWDQKRCIHVAACVAGLPDVFDPDRRPWIDPDKAPDADALEATVMQCPTGALHLTRGGTNPETPPATNRIRLFPNGPLLVRGHAVVVDADGATLLDDTRVALCRCGLSSNKPLCDGSHDGAFDAPGTLDTERLGAASEAEEAGEPVRIQVAAGGPLILSGPFVLEGDEGAAGSATKAALCRCGASANKPFCDGSHHEADFDDAG